MNRKELMIDDYVQYKDKICQVTGVIKTNDGNVYVQLPEGLINIKDIELIEVSEEFLRLAGWEKSSHDWYDNPFISNSWFSRIWLNYDGYTFSSYTDEDEIVGGGYYVNELQHILRLSNNRIKLYSCDIEELNSLN
jgi:hypothetical protein